MERREEYKDQRWKDRADVIRHLDGHRCRLCGATNTILQVHHLSYPQAGFHLWDSFDEEMVTLCERCHKRVHDIEHPIRLTLDSQRNAIEKLTVIGDYDQLDWIQENEDYEDFYREYLGCRNNGVACCANCLHGCIAPPFLECTKRIDEDRDDTTTPCDGLCVFWEKDAD